MADIIPFKCVPVEEVEAPHLSGECFCGACGHEFVGVMPVGLTHIDCPKCKRIWGAMKHVVEPSETWACNCGERMFWLTPKGAMCRKCGIITTDWAD